MTARAYTIRADTGTYRTRNIGFMVGWSAAVQSSWL